MSMGRRRDTQVPMWVAYDELRASPGRRSTPPGVYFRMHLIGYFEGIESERGIEWRCADSLSLRQFLGLEATDRVPDHSTLSRMRQRLPLEVHEGAFELVLGIVESKGLLKGRVLGVDSTYLRADASMKAIVRRDTKESYPEFVKRLCAAAGMENPTEEDGRRLDRKRKGRTTSNRDWESSTDPDSRIARLKDGRTRAAYKPEHVVDLETGAIVGVQVHAADRVDSATLEESLEVALEHLEHVRSGPGSSGEKTVEGAGDGEDGGPRDGGKHSPPPCMAVVTDKGYHKAALLRRLKEQGYRSYIPGRRCKGRRRWTDKGGARTAAAFYENRARVSRGKGKALQRRRGEVLERTFAHVCETGGARRTRLRGRENVSKRYLLHVAGANLGLVMRSLFGSGTPRGWAGHVPAGLLHVICSWFGLQITSGRRHRAIASRWCRLRPFAVACTLIRQDVRQRA